MERSIAIPIDPLVHHTGRRLASLLLVLRAFLLVSLLRRGSRGPLLAPRRGQRLGRRQGEAGMAQASPTGAPRVRFLLRGGDPGGPGMCFLHPDQHHFIAHMTTGLVLLGKDGHVTLTLDLGIAKESVLKLRWEWEHRYPLFLGERSENKPRSPPTGLSTCPASRPCQITTVAAARHRSASASAQSPPGSGSGTAHRPHRACRS